MTKKVKLLLLLVLLFSIFMRFYNLKNFQYFTSDQENFQFMVRKVTVDKKPPLIMHNAQIGGSIGSFYILMSAPFFYLMNNDPIKVQLLIPILGVVATLIISWVGRLFAGDKVGLIAALLYGGSFLISFYEKSMWTLNLDSLMILLIIGSLIKLIQKKYQFFLLLTFASSFAWHSDPALAVGIVGAILTFIYFRIPLFRKEYTPGVIYLIISFLPLIIFEIRHPGTIIVPWLAHLLSRSPHQTNVIYSLISLAPWKIIENLSRSLAISPTLQIEQYHCYCDKYPPPFLSPIPEIITVVIITFSAYYCLKRGNEFEEKIAKLLLIFIASFVIGASIYSFLLSFSIYQHYFMTVFPTFLLLAAFGLTKLRNRLPSFSLILIIFFILQNTYSFINSSLQYPLWKKQQIVEKIIPNINHSTFSLYGYGVHSLTDGGWVMLFVNKKLFPNKSYISIGWDWAYRTHSLYPYNPDQEEGSKIIIFHAKEKSPINDNLKDKVELSITSDNMTATILDNRSHWFTRAILDDLERKYID